MSLAIWWLWRYHTLVDGWGSTLHGIAGSYRQSYKYEGVYSARMKKKLFLGKILEPEPALVVLLRRNISSACPRACTVATGTRPNDEDFSGGGNRVLDAFWTFTWSRRKLSGECHWRRVDDEGDWRYSPEWWGTQGGGWGRNQGDSVFEMSSSQGNGVVAVTAHPASSPRTSDGHVFSADQEPVSRNNGSFNPSYEVLGYEWRVLRFNSITRQSVAKVMILGRGEDAEEVVFLQQPNCIACEYIKSLISCGLATVSLAGLDVRHVATGQQKMRILCIGLGGGSLPLFLAYNLPGATVDAVEIDPVVISAAVNFMGFPSCPVLREETVANSSSTEGQESVEQKENFWGNLLRRISIYENDGVDFVWKQSQRAKGQYDLVFVDAYDGEDVVPFKFWDRNGHFLTSLSSVLNACHGTVVVNLHTDSAPPSLVERLSGKFGPGYDPTLPQGKRVIEAATAYRDVLLRGSDSWKFQEESLKDDRSCTRGLAFTVAVSLQGNISLVVSRGASNALKETVDGNRSLDKYFTEAMVHEAKNLQTSLKAPFDMTKRVSRGLRSL